MLLSAAVSSINGIGGFALNGASTASPDNATLTLTTQSNNEAGSAFYSTPGSFEDFTASFTYTEQGGSPGEGFTFTLENDPRGAQALGGAGIDLGYAGTSSPISPSLAVEFNIDGGLSTGFATNGGGMTNSAATGSVSLTATHPINVSISYSSDSYTLYETLTDSVSNVSYSTSYIGVNLPSILGGNLAYVGFTGGTGSLSAIQGISNFSFSAWTPSAWTPLKNSAPDQVETMLLLPNGSVMTSSGGSEWDLLTPDSTGSYVNRTWTRLADSNAPRFAFASQVLPDGRVLVAGGQNLLTSSETYNPLTNTWTPLQTPNPGNDGFSVEFGE